MKISKIALYIAISVVAYGLFWYYSCQWNSRSRAILLGGYLRNLNQSQFGADEYSKLVSTNYIYFGETIQLYTNQIVFNRTNYNCHLAIKNSRHFFRTGLLTITDKGLLLWIGDNGKIVVAPDKKNWIP